jgi:hypothetical protein
MKRGLAGKAGSVVPRRKTWIAQHEVWTFGSPLISVILPIPFDVGLVGGDPEGCPDHSAHQFIY